MSANLSGKFRHRKINFTQVSNSALQNPNLSLKAKGLYSLIQSLNSKPNYDLYKWNLISQILKNLVYLLSNVYINIYYFNIYYYILLHH